MEHKLKLILVGDTNVGKTALLNRRHNNIFNPCFTSTLGVDFHCITVRRNNTDIKVYLWDTAGQEKFANLINVYFRNLDGAMIIYDITNKNSFDSIEKWIEKINFHNTMDIPIIIVGTKTDIEKHRQINTNEVLHLAQKYDYINMECSSKENSNVDETFDAIIDIILKNKNFDLGSRNVRTELEFDEIIPKRNCCTIL